MKRKKDARVPAALRQRTASRPAKTYTGVNTAPAADGEAGPAFYGVSLRFPEPVGSLPPLPEPSFDGLTDVTAQLPGVDKPSGAIGVPKIKLYSLKQGAYFIRYIPKTATPIITKSWYEGTMRIEKPTSSSTTASGDLYLRQRLIKPPIVLNPTAIPTGDVDPSAGIPIFPRSKYRYYLRVTNVLEGRTLRNHFTLGFNMHKYTAATNSWQDEGGFTAVMYWKPAPLGYPSQYLEGEVKKAGGSVVGTLTMGWVSKHLRRATVEIDRVKASELPLDNGAGVDWRDVFDKVKWQLNVTPSNADVTEPSGESWSDAEMHAAMLARRDSADLDSEWRYHILCVRKIDSTSRGIMYDNGATDSNKVPREGVGLSSHWVIPNTAEWGKVKNVRFGAAAAPYFRTALHELGHAMGLYHNTADMGVMNTTDVIAGSAVPPTQFPDNIKWAHAADDQKRLRHLPDIWVRPGGIPFGLSYGSAPISPDDEIADADGLRVEATPLLPSFPIGAPVRVNFALRNVSDQPLAAPAKLNMHSGSVKGKVIDPAGTVRTFKPLVLCIEAQELKVLEPGDSVAHSLTLIRGAQGALFPTSGLYRIIIEIDWEVDGQSVGATGEATTMITGAQDEGHAAAAGAVLSEPDVLPVLVLGGDHLADGVAAVQAGLSSAVLRPHFAAIEARRVGRRFGARKPDFKRVATLIEPETVLSPHEMQRVAELAVTADAAARKQIGKVLKGKAEAAKADIKAVDEL